MNTFMDRVNAIVAKNQVPQANMQEQEVYPDAGMGALENVVSGAPRQTEIMGQPHMLAYINPQEENLLQEYRGDAPVMAGPDGVPAYWFHSNWGGGNKSTSSSSSSSSGSNSFTETLANIFTPFDGATYSGGQLVDSNTGARISSGGTTSTGNVISGIANSERNDIQGPMPAGTDFTGSQIGQDEYGSGSDNAAAVNAAVAEAIEYVPLTPNNPATTYTPPPPPTPKPPPPTYTPPTRTYTPPVTVEAPVVETKVSSGGNQGVNPSYLTGALPAPSSSPPVTTSLADAQQELNAAISKAQSANSSNDPDDYWNNDIAELSAIRDRIRDRGDDDISDGLSAAKSELTLTGGDSGALNFLPEGSNTLGETIINYLTPFGSKEYINGVLVDTDAGDFASNPLAANNASGYVKPEAGVGSALLDSAYAKISAGKNSELTTAEQMALYGQRGTVPNAAETVALQENYKASGKRTITQDMQDEIVDGMVANGATQAQINDYKEGSSVGSDANPFYDTYGELGVFGKIGKGLGDLANLAVTNATYGLINPQKRNEAAADAFVKAYESEGSTGGQFDWNDPNALDISPGAEGDANWEKLLEMSSSETGIEPSLQGVVGEDGETVSGVVEVKNTDDGPVIVDPVVDEDTLAGGGDDDDDVEIELDIEEEELPEEVKEIWKRYYKGSGAQFLPPWLRRWASGESIDLILTKVTVDGKVYYKTKDGKYIEPSELVGTAVSDVDGGSASPFENDTETEETEE